MRTILVTGGAGFIGSNFVRMLLEEEPGVRVVNLDLLTYAGNLGNLEGCEAHPRHRFVRGDVCDAALVGRILDEEGCEAIVHFAAESHVDRSLVDPASFITTNVTGTLVLLRAALERHLERFLQVSTDEVYGSLAPGEAAFTEETPVRPSSPYSASKAAADHLVQAFAHTWGLRVNITRCSNNYGPFQFPEKLIPLMIHNALHGHALPVYGDGLQVRDWLHVRDHCRALWTVLTRAEPGAVYNVGGVGERTNLAVVGVILDALGKPRDLIRHVTDRPGHDRRYAIDASKIRRELGWSPAVSFEEGMGSTIRWYLDHGPWLTAVTSGAYRDYYDRMYAGR
ncbi:MAG: dTDP-glucose 4,6-dehydratase [Deltaproteobacteria bacterium]|nr:dTDP-glucose 4,6-dehydratase [Deltaproteobacteria bacterium]